MLATLALSLQNVLARITQSPKVLPLLGGALQLGGYVAADANKLQVSLLVLLLRIRFVIPFLWLMLPLLKPGAWQEAKQVMTGTDLAWRFFGDRPSWQKWGTIGLIYIGCTWLSFSAPNASVNTNLLGIVSAILAGIVFAIEGIIAQSSFNRIHPATFTGLIFAVEWVMLLQCGMVE